MTAATEINLQTNPIGNLSMHVWGAAWVIVNMFVNTWAEQMASYPHSGSIYTLLYWATYVIMVIIVLVNIHVAIYSPHKRLNIRIDDKGNGTLRRYALGFPYSPASSTYSINRILSVGYSQDVISRLTWVNCGDIFITATTFTNGDQSETSWTIRGVKDPLDVIVQLENMMSIHEGLLIKQS